jgi:hypothetical protein
MGTMKQPMAKPLYRLPVGTLLAFYSFFGLLFVGFLQRHNGAFWDNVPAGSFVGPHISNFAITYFLLTGVGMLWLLMGVRLKAFLIPCIVLLLANLLAEGFLTILNTRDWLDALYGVLGVLAGMATLWLLDRQKVKL